MDYSSRDRASIFERFIKPKFPTEYWIHTGDFTNEEVATIQQGYQNWEPVLQRLTGTPFHFRFMGYALTPVDGFDNVHIILRVSLSEPKLASTYLLFTQSGKPIPGGDMEISSNKSFHTMDQWHLKGIRMYFSGCLEAIVTHEVGHLMGLNHSLNPDDIMYPQETMTNCAVRKPSANDEYALEQFYLNYLTNFDFTKNFNKDETNF